MLEMKKNTRTKIATLAASAAALGAVFGLVHRNPPQTANAQPATLASAGQASQPAAAPTSTTSSSTSQSTAAQAQSSMPVHTRTRAS